MTLQLDTRQQLDLAIEDLIGESVAVLGIKGSGKTNTAAVLVEELLAAGLPMTIVDIEGEYWGLKERFEILVAGKSDQVDLPADAHQVAALADFSVQSGVPLILDVSGFRREQMFQVLLSYFERLWQVCTVARKPYQVLLEEAHVFVPQRGGDALKALLVEYALRGRKRGLGLISVSQRSAKVEKDVLTQAGLMFLHRVVHPTDLSVYQDLIPWPKRDVDTTVRQLETGQAVVVHNYETQQVQVRLRHTFHAGATPGLEQTDQPTLKRIDDAMLADLRAQLSAATPPVAADDRDRRIADLEVQVVEKDATIAAQNVEIIRLKEQVDLLSKLSVKVQQGEGSTPPSPTTLAVERIAAGQIVTGGEQQGDQPEQPFVSTRAQQRLVTAQERKFARLLAHVKRQRRFHRSILCLLMEHEGQAFSIRELAMWLDLAEGSIYHHPPFDLMQVGLIKRVGKRGDYHYTSGLRELAAEQFSVLNLDGLVERILSENQDAI